MELEMKSEGIQGGDYLYLLECDAMKCIDVSEECSASIFSVENYASSKSLATALWFV
jgi:hypothetical protein